ncbi:hypothetical protein GQ600_25920 [Phytophthora cactorum]|nr:hypothetical protein GQ600_25920 [Phytophthora cactorum]
MLQEMVGSSKSAASNNKSSKTLVRHHTIFQPHFNGEPVSERVQMAMKRRHLSLDTLNVACLSLKMLVRPVARSRPKGDFVDAAASGGKLLIYEEMEAVVKSKAAAAEAKVKAKREAAETRAVKKVEAAALKTARQAAAAVARLRRREETQRKKRQSLIQRGREKLGRSCPSIVNRSSGDHLHVWSRYARNFSTASQLIEE